MTLPTVLPDKAINLSSRIFSMPEAWLRLSDSLDIAAFAEIKHKTRVQQGWWAFKFDDFTVPLVRKVSHVYIPAPIEKLYDWPHPPGIKPYSHQLDTAQFLTTHPKAFNLGAIGTGKTFSTLWAADYLRSAGIVQRVLIVAPKSTVTHVWGREIYRTFRRRKGVALTGPGQRRINQLRLSGADMVVTNHDALRNLRIPLSKAGFDMIIVDESTAIKTWTSGKKELYNRNESLREIIEKCSVRWLWLLSGGPMPQSPMDMYGQARLVCPDRIPRTKSEFEYETCLRFNKMMTPKPRPGAHEKIFEWIKPHAIRYSLEECVDMPPWISQIVEVDETDTQKRLASELRARAEADLSTTGKITAVNEGVYASKLLQIACGAVIYEDDEHGKSIGDIDCESKFEALEDVLESTADPVLVFAPWRGAILRVEAWLKKHKVKYALVDGSVTRQADRDAAFDAVQNGTVKVLLANPAAMAHGITLTRSNVIAWWGLPWRAEIYSQANGRIRRIGQTKRQVCFHLISSPMEQIVHDKLQAGLAMEGAMLELIRRSRRGS